MMNRMGLPTGISGSAASRFYEPGRAIGRKGEKQSFVCKVCNIDDLNSLETKTKHENGKDHVYNVFKAYKRGVEGTQPHNRQPVNEWLEVFEEVAPTRPVQRKNCFKLKEKLQDTPDLVVGLKYVREVIACSSEEEPYYYCELCPSKGQANMMFNHVLGKEHRKQVLKKLKPHIVNDNAR